MTVTEESASATIKLPDGGRFDVLRRIAVGGMAEIYLARKATEGGSQPVVVLKRILNHLSRDDAFVDMFTQEAKLAALFVHPNIAQVYEMGRDMNGRPYYVMEYVEGHDIRELVRRNSGPLPRDIVLGTIASAAAGLHYAHTLRDPAGAPLRIVHRDVTPSNIMMTHGGGIKVVDFGVAKAAMEGRKSTGVGILKGKVPYMSPEQVATNVELDARSDVFSLGICLWELLMHQRLFHRERQIEALSAIADGLVPSPHTIDPSFPTELERIVLKALAVDRDERYQTAHELQSDLEAFARDSAMVLSAHRRARFMDETLASERASDDDNADDATRVADADAATMATPGPESTQTP